MSFQNVSHMNEIKILVIDDEPQIRRLLQRGLHGYGYEVLTAENGEQGLTLTAQQNPQVVVLDVNLGSEPDGVEVCKAIREWSAVPIIILSVLHAKQTKLEALDAGADDYVTKPFDMDELEARIRAVLRRAARSDGAPPDGIVRIRDLTLDLVKHRVLLKGEELHLTPKEYELVRLLAQQPGKVLTNQSLLQTVWRGETTPPVHYVRVFINNIRKKLGENTDSPFHYIITEPGIGYRFTDQ
jgi:two-component system KDP operon response regulator KdpE